MIRLKLFSNCFMDTKIFEYFKLNSCVVKHSRLRWGSVNTRYRNGIIPRGRSLHKEQSEEGREHQDKQGTGHDHRAAIALELCSGERALKLFPKLHQQFC